MALGFKKRGVFLIEDTAGLMRSPERSDSLFAGFGVYGVGVGGLPQRATGCSASSYP